VTFPMLLDLNKYIDRSNDKVPKEFEDKQETTAQPSKSAQALNEELNGKKKRKLGNDFAKMSEGVEDKMEDEEEIAGKSQKDEESDEEEKIKWDELIYKFLQNGPYVYELYSVLIHRGSALGGHYYAYIKSFTSNKWFEFNDSQVSEITESDIYKTYGEDPDERPSRGGMFSMFHSSANAYMVMYRRVDRKRNLLEATLKDIPDELKNKVI